MSNPNDEETATGIALESEESLGADVDDEDTKVDGGRAEAAIRGLGGASKDISDLMGDLGKMKKDKLPF